jgi:hypothetical protein
VRHVNQSDSDRLLLPLAAVAVELIASQEYIASQELPAVHCWIPIRMQCQQVQSWEFMQSVHVRETGSVKPIAMRFSRLTTRNVAYMHAVLWLHSPPPFAVLFWQYKVICMSIDPADCCQIAPPSAWAVLLLSQVMRITPTNLTTVVHN